MLNKCVKMDHMFKDQVVPIWSVIFDGNATKVYTYSDWGKLKCAIEGSIRSYLIGDDENADDILNSVNWFNDLENVKLIVLNINHLTIQIHRWEIDNSSNLFKVLIKCYDAVPDDLKLQMMSLFSNSNDSCD